ncbi:MAG TPA: beta-ketoacyl-[acyl-carrier-protein] synthase family protein [Candidatus Saccharimonadales bacterium]|nr:beta-ketoacyl-[acyl-carrier-protein] synthase family protein [Candidatus Saccharimonadales bacterium]
MAEVDPTKRIVITGMGMVSPLGFDVQSSWQALTEGRHGLCDIREVVEDYPQTKLKTRAAAPVAEFDLLNNPAFAANRQIRKDRTQWHKSSQLALEAAHQALCQAGLTNDIRIDGQQVDFERFGVSLGTGIGGAANLAKTGLELTKEDPRVRPSEILVSLPARPGEVVSIVLGPEGPETPIAFEEAIFEECATGNANIANAADQIRLGRADVVLAGGTESALEPATIAQFEATRAVDSSNNPDLASRPFDQEAKGLIFGEGAAVMVIESLEHARKRGAVILAELIGYGKSADAYGDTEPSGFGAVLALKRALASARIEPREIENGYVNAHATATPLGDPVEIRALAQIFLPEQVSVSSTKGATGHTFGAAGAIEAIFSIMAVRTGILPPTIKLQNPIAEAESWNLIANEAQSPSGGVDLAVNNSFGFGGPNYVTIWTRG